MQQQPWCTTENRYKPHSTLKTIKVQQVQEIEMEQNKHLKSILFYKTLLILYSVSKFSLVKLVVDNGSVCTQQRQLSQLVRVARAACDNYCRNGRNQVAEYKNYTEEKGKGY